MKPTINEFRSDIVAGLKEKARAGVGVAEMGHFVQDRLRCPREAVLPIIAYFCHAFHLPLVEAVPLQQAWATENEAKLASLAKAIDERMKEWDKPASNGARVPEDRAAVSGDEVHLERK